jgi:L-lysine 2,3-aminomutase
MSNSASKIHIKLHSQASDTWQSLLSNSKISTNDLLRKVDLESHALAIADDKLNFALKVPQPYLDKIERGNPNDPLLLQVLPQLSETFEHPGFVSEPLKEQEFTPVPGLIHKYQSRVLLVTTSACAIHCRYCFRRNFPYTDHQRSRKEWQQAFDYIEAKPEINEVILSGGDPLSLSDKYLSELLNNIASIKTVKRIRIHTRLLPCLPQRVTEHLANTLKLLKTKVVLVAHCNHPNELGSDTAVAFEKLKHPNITLLNQSVLLKGVNDNPDTLSALSERLFAQGVLPYYLFVLDKVTGASHFDLPIELALAIHRSLAAKLPGFLVPKLAQEEPGEESKTVLTASLT